LRAKRGRQKVKKIIEIEKKRFYLNMSFYEKNTILLHLGSAEKSL
jgi:hypothetical protein